MPMGIVIPVLLVGLVVFLLLGLEIAAGIGLIAAVGLYFFVDRPLDQFAFSAFQELNSFTLTAVPLYVFMGALLFETGVAQRVFDHGSKVVGYIPGGLASSVILGNAVFGAMSGSSVAATATFGKVAYPNMERLGYSPRLSLGTISVGGTLSVLIPPSVILVVYGSWLNISVARLFAAAVLPAILVVILLLLTVMIMVWLKPAIAPKRSAFSARAVSSGLVGLLPFMLLIVITLGLVFGGIMTPTEAGAVGAFLSALLAFGYRSMSYRAFRESMLSAVKITSMIAFLLFAARVLAQVFQYVGLTETLAEFVQNLPLGTYGVLAVIVVMYLVLGCFFESFAMMVLTLPFVSIVVPQLGFDMIWFGVLFVMVAEIGQITPPFGLNLYVLDSVVPGHSVLTIARAALPFLIPLLLAILIMILAPQIALWLPKLMY